MSIQIKRKKPLKTWMVLLMPLALIFWLITAARNALFDFKIIRPARFSVPTIGVGNLSIGGTGKTPHVEHLVRLLQPYVNVATLSRGYGRKTIGFREVQLNDSADNVGDEPLLYKLKYPELGIFVGEQRAYALPQLMQKKPETQIVLLDDVYQHRSVSPYLNLLLTEYSLPYFDDFILPVGSLREWRSESKRADAIIVTKCPHNLTRDQKIEFSKNLGLLPHQKVFFSNFRYGNPYRLFNPAEKIQLKDDMDVVLFTAIAGTDYMVDFLKDNSSYIHILEFPDHHLFTDNEIGSLKNSFEELNASKKIILITEKDAVKFVNHRKFILENKLPVYVLPIVVEFDSDINNDFDDFVKTKLLNYLV